MIFFEDVFTLNQDLGSRLVHPFWFLTSIHMFLVGPVGSTTLNRQDLDLKNPEDLDSASNLPSFVETFSDHFRLVIWTRCFPQVCLGQTRKSPGGKLEKTPGRQPLLVAYMQASGDDSMKIWGLVGLIHRGISPKESTGNFMPLKKRGGEIYIPYHPCICMVYLPDMGLVDFYGFHVGKYTSPMDAIGFVSWRLFSGFLLVLPDSLLQIYHGAS